MSIFINLLLLLWISGCDDGPCVSVGRIVVNVPDETCPGTLERMESELKLCKDDEQEKKSKISAIEMKTKAKDNELAGFRAKCVSDIDQLKKDIEKMHKERDQLDAEVTHLEGIISSFKSGGSPRNEDLLKAQLEILKAQLASKEAELKILEAAASAGSDPEKDALRLELSKVKSEIQRISDGLSRLNWRISILRISIKRLRGKLDVNPSLATAAREKALEADIKDTEQKIDEGNEDIKKLEEEVEKLKNELAVRRAADPNAAMKEKLSEEIEDLKEKKKRLEELFSYTTNRNQLFVARGVGFEALKISVENAQGSPSSPLRNVVYSTEKTSLEPDLVSYRIERANVKSMNDQNLLFEYICQDPIPELKYCHATTFVKSPSLETGDQAVWRIEYIYVIIPTRGPIRLSPDARTVLSKQDFEAETAWPNHADKITGISNVHARIKRSLGTIVALFTQTLRLQVVEVSGSDQLKPVSVLQREVARMKIKL